MNFELANNLNHFFIQFCGLPSKGNEYAEWAPLHAQSAITAPNSKTRFVTVALIVGWIAGLICCATPNKSVAQVTRSPIEMAIGGTTQAAQDIDWRTGKALDAANRLPLSVSWQSAPLRQQLKELSSQQKIAIVLDRRVDPNSQINLQVAHVSLEQLLLKVARQQQSGFCRVEDAYYVGPAATAEFLLASTGANQSARSQIKRNSRLLRKSKLAWPDLATPQEVLEQLATDGGLAIDNLERLPHDLMASVDLPPMKLIDRIGLLLAQFDYWYRLSKDGSRLQIVEMPPAPKSAIVQFTDYDPTSAQFKTFKQQLKNCRVTRSKGKITVKGPPADLVAARDLVTDSFVAASHLPDLSQRRFTLAVNNRRLLILNAIAKQLNLQVKNEAVGDDALNDVVQLEVKEVSLDELLAALTEGSGLEFVVDGQSIVIRQASSPTP